MLFHNFWNKMFGHKSRATKLAVPRRPLTVKILAYLKATWH